MVVAAVITILCYPACMLEAFGAAMSVEGVATSFGQALSQIPRHHIERFHDNPRMRYLLSFLGGVIVLWGARLAGGCTSGHMMSGMMQTTH